MIHWFHSNILLTLFKTKLLPFLEAIPVVRRLTTHYQRLILDFMVKWLALVLRIPKVALSETRFDVSSPSYSIAPCTHLENTLRICGNKMPTRCKRGFYCKSYCLLNIFRAPLCPSSGAQEYYTVVAACGISCYGFASGWSGVELRVMCPVCRILLSSWWWA